MTATTNGRHPQVELAEKISREAHDGQFRRDGVTPYINHVEDVVSRLKYACWTTQSVGWLHDVLEDCKDKGYTVEKLRELGVAEVVINGVLWLTNQPGEDYHQKIERIAQHTIPRDVKIADNFSNLSDSPSPKQVKKYSKSLSILISKVSTSYQHPC